MGSISRICAIELACDLCGDWKKLGHVLGLSREVEGISQDYRRNGVCEQAYRMLKVWKQKNGSDATYEVLGKALKRDPLLRVDLAEKYCDGGNQDTLKTDIHSLKGHLKCGAVSSSDMFNIAADLGKEWMWVGRLLGLEDPPLDSIKGTHDRPYEWCYQMLLLWKQENGTHATYSWLAQVLLHRAVGKRFVAEKYCIELQQSADGGASCVPHEEKILQLNEKMEKLQVNLPRKGPAGSSINSSRSAEAKVVTKSETDSALPPFVPDDCIRKKLITSLPYKVWGDLVVKLNPPRELQMRGDYKDLAGEMGYGVEKILYFQSLPTPAEAVLSSCSPTCSIEKLCNKLEAIGRHDARGLIDEWVKSQDCKCTLCCS